MKLDVREAGEVAVLDLSGKLTRGDGDELLSAAVDRLLASGQRRMLLNLAGVPYMDSAGIGAVMAAYRKATMAGGTVKLLNPHKRVYDVLQVVKLDSVFATYHDEATAIAAFE